MFMFYLFVTVISHICASVFLAKPRFCKLITILIWSAFGVIFLILPKETAVINYHITLILNIVLFLLITRGRLIEKGFLFLSYVCMFSCCSAMINCFVFGHGSLLFQTILMLLIMGALQYVVYGIYVPAFRKVSPYIDKEWLKYYSVVVIFFVLVIMETVVPDIVHEMSIRETAIFFMTVAAFLVSCISMFFGMNNVVELAREKRKSIMSELLSTQVEAQAKEVETARRNRHDMRHHYSLLLSYAKEGKVDCIIEYLEEQTEIIDSERPLRFCENDTINNIIRVYHQKAKESGIHLDTKVDIKAGLGVANPDLVVILANIMENAVHGAVNADTEEPWITLDIYNREERLVINCENSCDANMDYADMPDQYYGTGINSIIGTADKYDGSCRFTVADGIFKCITIMNT